MEQRREQIPIPRHPITTRTSRFKAEFDLATRPRRRYLRGRLFAHVVAIEIGIVNSEEIRLRLIEVMPLFRRKGNGSDAMKWLCELADNYGVRVSLCALPSGQMELLALTNWYQKHGFFRLQLADEMLRLPNVRPN